MELLAGYDSDEESGDELCVGFSKTKESQPLPSPNEMLNQSTKSSIFKLALDSDLERTKVLEKHVKMVENKNKITEVNGRKVCLMYRQGRCRAGRKCRMYHDSELRDSSSLKANVSDLGQNCVNTALQKPFDESNADIVSEDNSDKSSKKKRYGLSNCLEPPKKALKQIRDIQFSERRYKR